MGKTVPRPVTATPMPIHTRTNHGALIPINETPAAKPRSAAPVLTPQAAVTVELLGQLHETLAHLRSLSAMARFHAERNSGMESLLRRCHLVDQWTGQFPM